MGYEESKYQGRIRITLKDLEWIKQNKGLKSAAGFLEEIIREYRKPNLFKKRKQHELL